MDQQNLTWLSFDGLNRSTVAIIVIIIVILVILLIIRAIIIRRKASESTSLSPDAQEYARRKRISDSGPEEGHGHRHGDFHVRTAPPAITHDKVAVETKPVNLGTVVSVPPTQNKTETRNVHFQQGPVVQTPQVINPEISNKDQQEVDNACPNGDCGAQMQAEPRLVQAQQNIHAPSPEIPAYPQRQTNLRNQRFAAQQRRPIQPQKPTAQQPTEKQNPSVVQQPRSNYRLQRGREVN